MPPAALPCPPGCPPGLQYLTMLDHILVHQQVELLEVFTGEIFTDEILSNQKATIDFERF